MAVSGFKKINFPYSISMDTALPVDYNSFFNTFAAAAAAAATAVEAGEIGSKYYIGQLITVADVENEVVRYYKITPEKTLKELAAEYTVTKGLTAYPDSLGNTVIQIRDDVYANNESTYTLTKMSSANWTKAYGTVFELSGDWQDAATYSSTTSAKHIALYNTLEALSGKWNEAYATQNQWKDKWISSYLTMLSTSGKWHSAYLTTLASSSRWNEASTKIESTSADNASVYSTVYNTSGNWNDAFTRSNKIYSAIPEETWVGTNSIADKNYVLEQVRSQSSVFRGSFATWSDIPTTSAGYNSDLLGNKIPLNNDYLIVLDDSENTMTVLVSSNPIGEITSEDVMDFYGTTVLIAQDTELSASHITLLETNNIESVEVYRTGSWRYKYVGVWQEGYAGKANWHSEYRVSQYPFTQAQLAAINSGITKQKADKIVENSAALVRMTPLTGKWNEAFTTASSISANSNSVFASVESASGTWNTVVEKIAEDYFKYYSASAWSILTDDDTDYSNVPSGMVLIYEDDGSTPVPIKNLSIYTKNDGYLRLSKDITYDEDFGYLYIGGNVTFDYETDTLTIPGSSDIVSDTIYNYDTGIMKFSESMTWDSNTQVLTLGNGTSFDSTSGIVTIQGKGEHDQERTTFNVTNILTNVKNDNTATYVSKNQAYLAVLHPINDNYRISSLSCTMGGIAVLPYGDTSFNIPSVTGDIVINAVGVLKEATMYSITNNLTNATTNNSSVSAVEYSEYTASITPIAGYTITSISCTMGGVPQTVVDNYISIVNVTGNIVITATAAIVANPRTTYYKSNGLLSLASDIYYNSTTQILSLGNSVDWNSDNTLEFTGVSAEAPIEYATVTNNLTHAVNNNLSNRVVMGGSYTAQITAADGYTLNSVTCTMGGTAVTVTSDNKIVISAVNGNIVITATASYIGYAEFDLNNGVIKLAPGSTFIDNILTLGPDDKFLSDSIVLSGIVISNNFAFNTSNGIMRLSNDTTFDGNNILKFGQNASFNSSTNMITLTGNAET